MENLRTHFNRYFINIKTFSGNNQVTERKVIDHMETLFHEIDFT